VLSHPDNLKYVKTHEYIRVEGEFAVIGITAFAGDQLGDVTFVELPKVGEIFKNEAKFGVIESVKSVSDLFMPLAGEVVAVNEKLNSEPELVNSDCYGEGWMLKVKMLDSKELDQTMDADAYKKFIVE
jgi:glycine cleavage system H protein